MYCSSRKKQRGQQRRLHVLLKLIDELIPFEETSDKYEHFHVPGSMFIQHPKTSGSIKTAFCRKWIEKTERIMEQKPYNLPFCKITALIAIPNLWDSQIIIFYDKEYYDSFWTRNGQGLIWAPIANNAFSFKKARNISTILLEKGYMETISNDDGTCEKSLLWFYGDVD